MSEPIKVWRKDGFSLKLWETGRRHPNGQELLRYEFRDGKRLIFSGSDFGASPLHAIDSLQTVYALLDFLSAGEGATDADYFSGYAGADHVAGFRSAREALRLGERIRRTAGAKPPVGTRVAATKG